LSLALQLEEKDRLDPAMQALTENLEMLAAGKLDALKRKCGVDDEDFAEMVAELKSLNPKPGTGFARDDSQIVIPDVLLRRGKDGAWVVELNSHTLPRLLVNRRYLAQLQTSVGGASKEQKEDRKYLSEALANANWLVKALDQRAQSLLKVATEIVAQQQAFFRHGVTHLRPMTLKDIADNVGVHESTVSRVTTNKFIGSARGLFELKFFFTSSLTGEDGDNDISSKAVQHYIRELVDGETAGKILSDDAIAEILQGRGINVARRTVAKYRDILKIPSSSERRRAKKMGL
jgi:RNA polymerase sigma-54 factor